ncbi:MAG: MFS transporter [Rhizobiaceae bacterium]|nr:MFS transporter [Rhizobiaceae bacterium]MCV0404824.1 MFS transporter [Rhizobiaceae bacterium]
MIRVPWKEAGGALVRRPCRGWPVALRAAHCYVRAMHRSLSPVPAIVFLLVAGVFAGAQLAKIAPLVAWYRDDQGHSLVFIGWLISTIGLFVALAALPVSLAIDRVGQFRVMAGGSLLLALGAVGVAFLDAPLLLLAMRVVEAVGYLVLVIVIPAILNGVSPPALKAPVLAIWGGFVPVGFALADFMAAGIAPVFGPRVFLFAVALGFALSAALACLFLSRLAGPFLAPVRGEAAPGLADSLSRPVVLTACAFGAFVIVSLAFFSFLPVAAERGLLALSPGLVALTVPTGNALAGVAMRGRGLRAAVTLGMTGFVLGGLAAWPAFQSSDPLAVTVAAVVLAVSGGITGSALFASVPFIVPAGGSASVVIGLICQAGGLATVLGPPLAGMVIETGGWAGYAVLLAAASFAGLALLAPLVRRGLRPA